MSTAYRYLEVEFGDNDYGLPVEHALQRLWADMHRNNAHLLPEGQTMADQFRKLQKHKRLLPLVSFLVDVEDLASHAEYATRGVDHYERFPPEDDSNSKMPEPPYESVTNSYLGLTLRFRTTKAFAKKWQNSEHAYLDLVTGDAQTF